MFRRGGFPLIHIAERAPPTYQIDSDRGTPPVISQPPERSSATMNITAEEGSESVFRHVQFLMGVRASTIATQILTQRVIWALFGRPKFKDAAAEIRPYAKVSRIEEDRKAMIDLLSEFFMIS